MTIKLEATGHDDYIPEDRPTLFGELRPGNTDIVEIQLTFVSPEGVEIGDGEPIREIPLGQFRLADFASLISQASRKVLELQERYSQQVTLEVPVRPTTLEV